MYCKEWEKKGILYFYNELDASAEYAEYQEHLKTCKICQENIESLKLLNSSIVSEEPSDECLEKIYSSSFAVLKDATSKKPMYFFRTFTVALTATVLLLLFLKKDIFKRHVPVSATEIETELIYISEKINKLEKEIELLITQRKIHQEIEDLKHQLETLSYEIENL